MSAILAAVPALLRAILSSILASLLTRALLRKVIFTLLKEGIRLVQDATKKTKTPLDDQLAQILKEAIEGAENQRTE